MMERAEQDWHMRRVLLCASQEILRNSVIQKRALHCEQMIFAKTEIVAKNEQNPMLACDVCQRLTERLWTFRHSEFLPEASKAAADPDFLQIIQLSQRKQALLPCLHETD
jgi:hypothetical protein